MPAPHLGQLCWCRIKEGPNDCWCTAGCANGGGVAAMVRGIGIACGLEDVADGTDFRT